MISLKVLGVSVYLKNIRRKNNEEEWNVKKKKEKEA